MLLSYFRTLTIFSGFLFMIRGGYGNSCKSSFESHFVIENTTNIFFAHYQSFIEKNVDMPRLHKHMMDAFPDRKRNKCSFYGRRESLFKNWKKSFV